jgi:hypothetical protein
VRDLKNSDVVRDLKSWTKQWNDAAMRRIGEWPERRRSTPWPLLGMLALGLVAGAALGGYAVSQRGQLRRLSAYAQRMSIGLAEMRPSETKPVSADTVPLSNHRRKATSEV